MTIRLRRLYFMLALYNAARGVRKMSPVRIDPELSQSYFVPVFLDADFTECALALGDTVATEPALRAAYATRRCLVLADGYYAWLRVGVLDFILTGSGSAPRLLRNDQSSAHHWLRLQIEGKGKNTFP